MYEVCYYARLTSEYEGDGEDDKEATVEADAESCPGESGLKNTQDKTCIINNGTMCNFHH